MATPRSTPDPFDSVRDAFSGLGTSEKAAFVLEATFETIGQALAETGRRAAEVVDDLNIDSWFRAEAPDLGAPPAPPPAPKAPAKRKRPAAKKPPSKTAGKPPRPPADDAS